MVDVKSSFDRAKKAITELLKERDRLGAEIKEIDRMLRELGWKKPPAPRGKKGQIASAEGTKLAAVLEVIESEPGSTVGEISAATGFSSSHVAAACSTLVTGGKIYRTGKRGTYSYFLADGYDDPPTSKRLLGG
jgi:hypothetical protein